MIDKGFSGVNADQPFGGARNVVWLKMYYFAPNSI